MGTTDVNPPEEVRELHRMAAQLERMIERAADKGNTAEACLHSSTLARVQARIVASCPLNPTH